MLIDQSLYSECLIISGYKLTENEFKTLSSHLDFNSQCDAITSFHYQFNFVGSIITRIERSTDGGDWSNFSIEDIRDYSTNDSVRNVRFHLMKLFPEKFTNEYPKLFIVTV